jgi:two-component system sensor histidine kinase DesK
MMTQPRTARGFSTWVNMSNPLIWLVYLPFFFMPWYFNLPAMPQIVAALFGIAVFLGFYVASIGTQGMRLVALAAGTLIISFALAFTDSNWPVIAVYAGAMIGELRPSRQAGVGLAIFAAATVVMGLALGQHVFYWAPGVLLMVMVGIGCISRSALEDKNRALANAQDEVRQMAATAERERIGRDMHDLLGRSLTLIAIKADLAAKLASRDATRAEAEMREIATAAREALSEVRAAVAGMTGASLARELANARAALASAGIACHVEGDVDAIEQGAGAVLAMTLREAVTNVIRHSGARSCRIVLTRHEGGIELDVGDDGDGATLREGGGLGGVRSRLAAAGGGLSIRGDARGTRLVARLPAGVMA